MIGVIDAIGTVVVPGILPLRAALAIAISIAIYHVHLSRCYGLVIIMLIDRITPCQPVASLDPFHE